MLMEKWIKRLLPALLLVALSGCHINEAVYRYDGSRIVYLRSPLMKVMDELNERHLSAQTVVARLNVILRNNEKNKETPLTGVYLGDKDGNLRLQLTASTGKIILDMANHNNTVDVWLPLKSRYFQGKRQDLLNNSQCQLSLIAHVGRARDLFFPRAWSDGAIEYRVTYQNGREVISVLEKPNFIRRRSRRITLAPESACVEMMEVYDKFGREVGIVTYSDYRFPESNTELAAEQNCPLIYPGCVKLHSPDGMFTLEFYVEEFILDSPIAASKFEVPKSENSKILNLGQALKHSGNLWE
ncbi:MAG: hypothetical protein V1899_13030 [Planctomycetota bacterium]